MKSVTITGIQAEDRRFPLHDGAGSDAVHSGTEYAFAVTRLKTDGPVDGIGIALTLGRGNELVRQAIEQSARALVGREIEGLMAEFGAVSRSLADDPALR
jgi:L-fuconate dehydratase